jgi:uncharacterized protein YfiM (DUF2279 family)
MLKLVFTILFLLQASLYASAPSSDKILHFTISGVIGGGMEYYLYKQGRHSMKERIVIASVVGTIPGLAKEIMDSREKGNRFSKSDLAYDAAGAIVGAAVSAIFLERFRFSVANEEAMITWSTPF